MYSNRISATHTVLGAILGVAALIGVGTAAAQQADIVIGTTSVLSGTNARAGVEQLRGLQLWAAELNERGGMIGRRVQIKALDDRGDFEAGAALYEKLIAEDKVDVLIGPYSAEVTPAAAAVAERHGMPLIAPGAAASELWGRGYRHLFGLYTPPGVLLDQVLDLAHRRGLRRVALIHQDSVFGRDVAEGVRARARALGLRIVVDESYDSGLTDFSTLVNRLKAKHPDAIVAAAHLPDAIFLMKKAKELKLTAKIVAFAAGASLPEFGKSLGADADSVLGGSQWEPTLKLAGVAEFARRYKAKHGYDPGYIAAGGYAAGQVLEAAARKAGTIEPARLRNALSGVDAVTVLGRYRVDAAGRQVGKAGYVVQWIGGERVPVLPVEVATTTLVYPFRSWVRR